MLRLYDSSHNFIMLLTDYKDLCITTSLETGQKSLKFKLPLKDNISTIMAEEQYIETEDYNYVIKEINMSANDYFDVYCNANLEDLKGNVLHTFDAIDLSITNCIKKIIDQLMLPWSVESNISYHDAVQYQLAKMTVYECLMQVKQDYNLEYWFDTKLKKLYVYAPMGYDRGVAFLNELRLNRLTRQGQSYDFATVLFPYGKDGLSIRDINNGNDYIENFSYSNKRIIAYYINEDLEYREQLKSAAEDYLAVISSPIVSYSVDINSLPTNLNIGDTIILIDNIKKIKQKQRVVKIINYPQTPERDRIELSNEIVNFANTFTKFNSDYRKTIKYVKDNLATLQ